MGESGSGKTTLARALIGLQPPTAGQVLLDGQPLGYRTKDLRAVPSPRPDDPPGPGRRAEPAAHRLRLRRRGTPAARARPTAATGPSETAGRRRAVRGRAAAAGAAVPALPARAVRWPAAAGAHRRRAGAQAGAADRRRAGLQPGRLDPRRDPGAAAQAARRARPRGARGDPRPRAWPGTSPTGRR